MFTALITPVLQEVWNLLNILTPLSFSITPPAPDVRLGRRLILEDGLGI